MAIFEELESEVRSYCRHWPVVFDRAAGSWLYAEDGRAYLDFFTGAGALNYGHNNPAIKQPLMDYLAADRVVHALDMYTAAKREFLSTFDETILKQRDLHYRVQFPGPAGASAVEAALKLARKVTGRTEVLCFTNAFHGMTLGALGVTGSNFARAGAGVPLAYTTRLPFEGAVPGEAPFVWFDRLMGDAGSGLGRPAAVILETVQGEGGINVAGTEWLQGLAARCQAHDILLIVDDVQMGCGRTGPFFSFEGAGITPDIVCLSKSISGYGLPMALTLIKPDLDLWAPGEHNGTFRGFNPAFVTATAALKTYWQDRSLEARTAETATVIATRLEAIAAGAGHLNVRSRGRGLAHGLVFENGKHASMVSSAAFDLGLLVETAGPDGEVVKLLPPLTASAEEIEEGLGVLELAVRAVC
jgi:diaminobutyrate-2-oxoglutarate transaminase